MKPIFTPTVSRNSNGNVTIQIEVPQNIEGYKDKLVDYDSIAEDMHTLILWRAEHCQNQLAENVLKGETYVTSPDSDIIYYKNGGHFSTPVYETMTEFFSTTDVFEIRKAYLEPEVTSEIPLKVRLLHQQALRSLIAIRNDKEKLSQLNNSFDYLANVLTESLLLF